MPRAKKTAPKPVDKEYRLAGDIAPLSYIVKVGGKGNLLIFDEKSGGNRAIRHCRNERSIFIDEQSDNAVLDPIIIERGYLKVPYTEASTQKFMDAHPGNTANGGHLFYEVDEDKEAEDALKREDLVLQLKNEVIEAQKTEKGVFQMEALVAVLKGSSATAAKLTTNQLRREIFLEIDNNPFRFSDGDGKSELFGPDITRRHLALSCMASNIIRTSGDGRQIIWAHNGETITNVPAGVKPTDHLFEFLETDDGILVLEEMEKRK